MATLRSKKYLSCFYCGRRSKFRFEGQQSFVCTNCDATNWLDEHGDITDPPTATSPVERSQVQFAIPRSTSVRPRSISPNSPGPEESIFCNTCLRNQHMLTSSLAQFEWPDDNNGPEYAAREKKYWALRKDLEKRYPQMCVNCEPMVEKKLHEASYTAQTDHLRRMMDRTRSQRQEVKKRGILDIFDSAGKWSWHLGFFLQLSWHIATLWCLIIGQVSLSGTNSWLIQALKDIHQLGYDRLPDVDRLIRWAIKLGICSLPWNPRFKHTIRGFTAHYLGFKQWYTYQLLILLIRYAGFSMAQYSSSKALQPSALLSAHLAIALLTVYVYYASKNAIHTDTSPLFRRHPKAGSPKAPRATSEPQKGHDDLGSILDEIAQSPVKSHVESPQSSPHSPDTYQPPYQPTTLKNGISNGIRDGLREDRSSMSTFRSLSLSDSVAVKKPEPSIVHYDEEMDWTPSASQHRAFSSYNPYRVKNTNPRFSDTPIEPKPGPIWYKVPPAPTNPAQRLRNPPMRPIIRESPKEKKENFFQSAARGPVDMGSSSQGTLADVKFADPQFFAPDEKDDPRDKLSKMFASSFSISPSPDEERFRSPRRAIASSLLKFAHGATDAQNRRLPRIIELLVVIGALCAWITAQRTKEQYGPSLAVASVIACLIVSIRLAADLHFDAQVREGKPPSIFTLSWANLGLAEVIASLILAWGVWAADETVASYHTYGNAHFAAVIIHHSWHTFV
ncbi:Ima1 N-terminal domain-containing protein [Hypomontagnella monticulosa]|nr:Ima1 N-terminal domain-containing protein [Hypomontagnella monticulosa]